MDSTFDPTQFLQTNYKEANDTKHIACPAGEWLGQISKITARKVEAKDGSGMRLVVDFQWDVMDDKAKKMAGVDKLNARQSIFVDLTEQGAIDFSKGHNVYLGKLREACGMNKPGKAFSISMLMGSTAYIFVEHQPNPNDPEAPYANVTRVAKDQGGTLSKKAK